MRTQADTDEVDDLATLEVLDEVRNRKYGLRNYTQKKCPTSNVADEKVIDLLVRYNTCLLW